MPTAWKFFKGPEVTRRTMRAQRAAVRDTLEEVLEASQDEVPVRTRALKESGGIKMADADEPTGVVFYGGGRGTGQRRRFTTKKGKPTSAVFYAIIVHEREARHPGGGKSGFLRDPFNQLARPRYDANLLVRMRQEGF